jgi:mRNA-capping enzyme
MMMTCPSTPEWKRSDDLNLNDEAKQDDDDDNGDLAPPHVCIFHL